MLRVAVWATLFTASLTSACGSAEDAKNVNSNAKDVNTNSVDSSGEGATGSIEARLSGKIPANSKIVAAKQKSINGRNYFFIKTLDESQKVTGMAFDDNDQVVNSDDIPKITPEVISAELAQRMATADSDSEIKVVVAIRNEYGQEAIEEPVLQEVILRSDGRNEAYTNGVATLEEDKEQDRRSIERLKTRRNRRAEIEARNVEELTLRNEFLKDRIDSQQEGVPGRSLVLSLSAAQIRKLAEDSSGVIAGIELFKESEGFLSSAKASTYLEPYAGEWKVYGRKVGIYMTENACPDIPPDGFDVVLRGSDSDPNGVDHAKMTYSILHSVAPGARVFCKAGRFSGVVPRSEEVWDSNFNKLIHLVTTSAGNTDDGDKYTIKDRDFDSLVYDYGIPVFVASGNGINGNYYVASPGKGLNVTTVGSSLGYAPGGNQWTTSGYIDPETGNQKPEILAPGSGVVVDGRACNGTSVSTPIAAGIAADIMSNHWAFKESPALLKAAMLAGAGVLGSIPNGDPDMIGEGQVNFVGSNFGYGYRYDGDWSYWDARDISPNNGVIDLEVYLEASTKPVKIALAWLTDAYYTYDHRADVNPIGVDLDLYVTAPDGSFVDWSNSWDNAYEACQFAPQSSGNYRIQISRWAQRDVNNVGYVGLFVRNYANLFAAP